MELEVVRSSYGTPDAEGADYGHGARTQAVVGTFAGLIQPRRARERDTSTDEGATIGDYRGYLEAAALGVVQTTDVLRKPAVSPGLDLAGDYTVLFVGNAAGRDHHVELDLERVTP